MKKAYFIYPAVAVIIFFCLPACVTVGHIFPHDFASGIVIGKTTRAEVEIKLGEPFRTGLDSGNQTASYLHYHFGLFSKPVTSDLTIVYTADNKVKSYTFNSNQTPETDDKNK
jgi:hypothetical protein